MAKAMRVPVLVFENKEDAEIILESIGLYERHHGNRNTHKIKVQELINEIRKIVVIFEKTNNN
tara:strand:+ start:438 stop:626 length:189 start_codon:yes stop_codon:yes gene_type:complete